MSPVRGSATSDQHSGHTTSQRNMSCMEKATTWKDELERLSSIAKTEPHAAFSALTHGLMSHWTFLLRSIEGIANLLQPIEDAIRQQLIPAITGRKALNDDERDLLALPARLGGIGASNPTALTEEYTATPCVSRHH